MTRQTATTLRLANFRVSIDEERSLETLVCARLRIGSGQLRDFTILRQALDARREGNISFVYTVEFVVPAAPEKWLKTWTADKNVTLAVLPDDPPLQPGRRPLPERPVVVGFGPAGMFAALTLARHGYHPLVL